VNSKAKNVLIIFFDINGILHVQFILAIETVNAAYYCDIARQEHENVRRLRPELLRQKEFTVALKCKASNFLFIWTFLSKQYDPHPPNTLFA
jgi:hypothetical protein